MLCILKVIDCIVLLCIFSFSAFYFTPVVVNWLLSVNRLASHHTSASTLQVFHLETVTSLLWVEKIVLAIFFKSLLGSQLCYLCPGAKSNNGCECHLSRGCFTV